MRPLACALFSSLLLACSSKNGTGAGGTSSSGVGGLSSSSGATSTTTVSGTASSAMTSASTGLPDACTGIQPVIDPMQNRVTITNCLTTMGHAILAPGVFPIDDGFAVKNAKLSGDTTYPTLRLMHTGVNHVLSADGSAEIAFLHVDANAMLPQHANEAVIHVTGQGNHVHDVFVENQAQIPTGAHPTGIFFIDSSSTNNLVERADIHGGFYGAIFVGGLTASHDNQILSSKIHDNKCDGVTFIGFGKLVSSEVYQNGFNCENGPIPGASIYSLNNADGALIDQNNLHDDCGNIIDLDSVANFTITNNQVKSPGYQWGGQYPYCGGGSGMGIIDSTKLTITGNVVENGGSQNGVGDPNGVFSPSGNTASDLPAGKSTILAFWLGRRYGSAPVVDSSTIAGNQMRASCVAPCIGVGYFIGRRTGVDANGVWSAGTTNYLTKNDPFGSNIGSKRCGSNWYAGNSTCTGSQLDPDCNKDDPQHNPPGSDMFRNDFCP